jgi:hypothetical protein
LQPLVLHTFLVADRCDSSAIAAVGNQTKPNQRRHTETYVKPEAAITVFELLMMGGVSPETC